MLRSPTALSLLLTAALPAQAVVPANAQTAEGRGVSWVSGIDRASRHQFVFHERVLRSLAGKSIRSIKFRRDRWGGDALQGSTSRLTVRVAPALVPPSAAHGEFARNRPSVTPAFQGTISIPASPAFTGPTTWSAANTVTIPLTTPVAYSLGQHLCVEIEGEPVQPPTKFGWPVDYESRGPRGTVHSVGTGCGATGRAFERPLTLSPMGLVAGANVRVVAFGRLHTPGFLLIGPQAPTIALDALGMPGCNLHVTPQVTLPMTHGVARETRLFPSANIWLPIPRHQSVLGVQFSMQAANLETGTQRSNALGVTTTNALRLTVSPSLPDPDWTTVWSNTVSPGDPLPTAGTVRLGFVPVLRFDT